MPRAIGRIACAVCNRLLHKPHAIPIACAVCNRPLPYAIGRIAHGTGPHAGPPRLAPLCSGCRCTLHAARGAHAVCGTRVHHKLLHAYAAPLCSGCRAASPRLPAAAAAELMPHAAYGRRATILALPRPASPHKLPHAYAAPLCSGCRAVCDRLIRKRFSSSRSGYRSRGR